MTLLSRKGCSSSSSHPLQPTLYQHSKLRPPKSPQKHSKPPFHFVSVIINPITNSLSLKLSFVLYYVLLRHALKMESALNPQRDKAAVNLAAGRTQGWLKTWEPPSYEQLHPVFKAFQTVLEADQVGVPPMAQKRRALDVLARQVGLKSPALLPKPQAGNWVVSPVQTELRPRVRIEPSIYRRQASSPAVDANAEVLYMPGPPAKTFRRKSDASTRKPPSIDKNTSEHAEDRRARRDERARERLNSRVRHFTELVPRDGANNHDRGIGKRESHHFNKMAPRGGADNHDLDMEERMPGDARCHLETEHRRTASTPSKSVESALYILEMGDVQRNYHRLDGYELTRTSKRASTIHSFETLFFIVFAIFAALLVHVSTQSPSVIEVPIPRPPD